MFKSIISIVGPTGVGKTSFALQLCASLAKKDSLGFDLISVDSRQIYQDLKIISGADIPVDFVEHFSEDIADHYFEKDAVRIYGVSILPYQAEWSVSHFRNFAQTLIKKSWENNRLPILVGGTGLYHDHLFNPSPILDIKPNLKLREELAKLSLKELQERLKKISPERFKKLNNSDYFNPTRLNRAIEIATWEIGRELEEQQGCLVEKISKPDRHLFIGLKDSLENIKEKISSRVLERFDQGAAHEVGRLTDLFERYGRNKQLLSATGVKEIQAYLDDQLEKSEALEKWSLREFQYAKRQLTWWKNKPEVQWFDVSDRVWLEEALQISKKFILPSEK